MSGSIEFNCPHCDKPIRTAARYAGMQGPCPHCGKPVKVEMPTGAELAPMLAPRSASRASRTDANPILAGLIGCVLTVVLYAVFFLAVRQTYVGQLFTNRGVIPFITTLVFCWGAAILLLKYLAVNRQVRQAELELDLMPLQAGVQITPQNVETFLQHLESLPTRTRESILGRRIRGALEHFRWRNSVPEVQSYLASHAQIDASSVDSGYTLLRSIIWSIPILGFIGTVLGISSAVTGLAGSLKTADVAPAPAAATATAPAAEAAPPPSENLGEQMIQAMGLVTQGLAVAFDTTFVALVMAIFLLFPTEELKRIEYGMLDRIEGFTNESLLRRMSDESPQGLSPEVAKILEPAFRRHQQWLVEWQTKVAELGDAIGRDFERHASGIQQRLEGVQASRMAETLQMVQALGALLPELNRSMEQLRQASTGVAADIQSSLLRVTELQREIAQNSAAVAGYVEQLHRMMPPSGDDSISRVENAILALNASVGQLSALVAQASDAESDHAPGQRRRRLWGLLGG